MLTSFVINKINPDFDMATLTSDGMSHFCSRPLGHTESSHFGFSPFLDEVDDETGEATEKYLLDMHSLIFFKVKEIKKKLPSSKDFKKQVEQATTLYKIEHRVEELEQETAQAIEDKEMEKNLKVAFITETTKVCFIDKKNGLLVSGVKNYKESEKIIEGLRATTGSFPAMPLNSYLANDVSIELTGMVKKRYSEKVTLGEYGKFVHGGEGYTHTVQKRSIYDATDELEPLLKAQYHCVDLDLEYDGVNKFRLNSDFCFTKFASEFKGTDRNDMYNSAREAQETYQEMIKVVGGYEEDE